MRKHRAPLTRECLDFRGRRLAHLCVDMQRMFAEETDWRTPWMNRVLPKTLAIAERHLADTIFTRFIPPREPDEAEGSWRAYFERWSAFTLREIEPRLLELVDPLDKLAAQATVVDKPGYSPFHRTDLDAVLRERNVDTLVVTGGETDVCVLAAVLHAVDLGYAVVLPKDALCSSTDETHDALMTLYDNRFSQQVCLSDTDGILAAWEKAESSDVTEGPPAARRAVP